AVPCAQVAALPQVQQHYPALRTACTLIGSIMIQNRASLGGNLCNAAPSADGVPPLIVHEAEAIIAGPGGTRRLPVESVCTGPGQTCLAPGELLVALRLPVPPPHTVSAYLRFTPRNEMDIAVAGASAAVTLDPSTGTCAKVRIALGAVAPTPVRARAAEEYLTGKALTDEHLRQAAQLAVEAPRVRRDPRGPGSCADAACRGRLRGFHEPGSAAKGRREAAMSTKVIVETTINGVPETFVCEPRQTLLEVLREELGLTGAKEGC